MYFSNIRALLSRYNTFENFDTIYSIPFSVDSALILEIFQKAYANFQV